MAMSIVMMVVMKSNVTSVLMIRSIVKMEHVSSIWPLVMVFQTVPMQGMNHQAGFLIVIIQSELSSNESDHPMRVEKPFKKFVNSLGLNHVLVFNVQTMSASMLV